MTSCRKLAAYKMANEPAGHTLQPTALVHNAWLRLVGGRQEHWNSRRHFFCAAAAAMRRILIESTRRRQSKQRGGDWQRTDLDESNLALNRPAAELLDVGEALEKLARQDAMAADLVKLRYFVRLTLLEAAEALTIHPELPIGFGPTPAVGSARSWRPGRADRELLGQAKSRQGDALGR